PAYHRSTLKATNTAASYTLSLHDALPIYLGGQFQAQTIGRCALRAVDICQHPAVIGGVDDDRCAADRCAVILGCSAQHGGAADRSEEHTSELQSRENLVCRLLLEKKKGPK